MTNEKDILDFLAGSLDAEGQSRIENETSTNPALADDLKVMSLIWTESDQLKSYESFNEDSAWEKFQSAVKQKEDDQAKMIPMTPVIDSDETILRPRSSRMWSYVAVAATVTLLVAAGYFMFLPDFITVGGETWAEVTTLKDGTVVTLDDQNSSFTYPRTFKDKDERRVIVRGNATLDVAEDETKPFYVDNYKAGVRVLGTIFIIESSPELSSLENVDGAMRFFDIKDESNYKDLTEPGQKLSFDGSKFEDLNPPPLPPPPKDTIGQDYKLSFILDELTGIYDNRFIPMPNASINEDAVVRLNMDQSLEGMIYQLDSTARINYLQSGNVFYLYSLDKR